MWRMVATCLNKEMTSSFVFVFIRIYIICILDKKNYLCQIIYFKV